MIFESVKFRKFLEFLKMKIFYIFQIRNFWYFPNWKFLEFSKLQIIGIFEIFKIANF